MSNNCVDNNLPCSGCGACAVRCPASALSVKLSPYGFYEAVINRDKCVSCGLCLAVCPKFKKNYPAKPQKLNALPVFYAWANNDEARVKSASGAIAAELALWGINNSYKIAGVIYNPSNGQAKTVIADSKEGLEAFKGSKYLQSFTVDAFKEIVKSKHNFMVFATPCQAAGLRFLAKAANFEERVIIVDLFCHGVPSYKLWDIAKKEAEQKYLKAPVLQADFRDKKYGWPEYVLKLSDGFKSVWLTYGQTPFYRLFLSGAAHCESCLSCYARTSFDFSDIRIGDACGYKGEAADKGVSSVIFISEKGLKIKKALDEGGRIFFTKAPYEPVLKKINHFKEGHINEALRDKTMALLLKGAACAELLGCYYSFMPFGKRIICRVKDALPLSLKKAVKRLVLK